MEKILNILHFCVYSVDRKINLIFIKYNPLRFLTEISFVKKRYEKLGVDIDKGLDTVFNDKRFGISAIWSGGLLMGMLYTFVIGILHMALRLMKSDIYFNSAFFIVAGLITYLLCYLYVFKDDKYLKYFKEFEKWPEPKWRKNTWLTVGFTLGSIALFVGSLMI